MTTDSEKIELSCEIDEQHTSGFALRRQWSLSERWIRTLKVMAIFCAITLLVAFIPILHFILVPLFLVLGILVTWMTWFEKSQVLDGEVTCPSCNTSFHLNKGAEKWPKNLRCTSCFMTLRITKRCQAPAGRL